MTERLLPKVESPATQEGRQQRTGATQRRPARPERPSGALQNNVQHAPRGRGGTRTPARYAAMRAGGAKMSKTEH